MKSELSLTSGESLEVPSSPSDGADTGTFKITSLTPDDDDDHHKRQKQRSAFTVGTISTTHLYMQ